MLAVAIPLAPKSKRPLVKWGGDVTGSDGMVPDEWADKFVPGSNIALRTDGLVVIDCDNAETVRLWESNPANETPLRVKTSRGKHFYYRRPESSTLRPGPLAAGIDVKTGPGAYVLIPPSIHPDGTEYQWEGRDEGDELAPFLDHRLPIAPVESIEALREVSKTEVEGVEEGWDAIPEGMRNTTLASLAGNLRRQGASIESIAWSLAAINKRLCKPPLPDAELVAIAQSVARYEPEPDIEIEITGEGVEPEWPLLSVKSLDLPPPPEWLWHPYLPEGRLVLLDGSEGIGKGLFCANVATRVSNGTFGRSAEVLWMTAEDDPQEDILRRLLAAGYDRTTNQDVHFVDASPSFPRDIAELAAVIRDGDYRLVVMDPGRSYLGPAREDARNFSYNDEADIRPGLEKLNRLAKAANTTIIFVHHWNKNTGAAVEDRSGGSKAFRQVVRHAVSMAFVGASDTGKGALAVTKSNVGPTGYLLGYTIGEVQYVDDLEVATAKWVEGQPQAENRLEDWISHRQVEQENQRIDIVAMPLDYFVQKLGLGAGDRFPSPRQLVQRCPELEWTEDQAKQQIERFVENDLLATGARGNLFVKGELT